MEEQAVAHRKFRGKQRRTNLKECEDGAQFHEFGNLVERRITGKHRFLQHSLLRQACFISESANNIAHYVSVNVGQPKIPARIAVSELLVVKTHQVENRRVKVVHVDGVLRHIHPELIG